MANPLPNEQEIYERIKKENMVIHPVVWELINHHINNDLYTINLILGSTVLDGEVLAEKDAEKILNHVKAITNFLHKLQEATK